MPEAAIILIASCALFRICAADRMPPPLLKRLREAALADESGKKLDDALQEVNA